MRLVMTRLVEHEVALGLNLAEAHRGALSSLTHLLGTLQRVKSLVTLK
jgi:hypothetical protein